MGNRTQAGTALSFFSDQGSLDLTGKRKEGLDWTGSAFPVCLLVPLAWRELGRYVPADAP